jgi:Cu/Ag efflux pump CusA
MTPAGPGLQAALIAFSLRFRGVVIALATLLTAAGVFSFERATYDVFPEFAPPQAVIHTEAPGLSPDQVEVLITQPLENALSGAPGLLSLRSSSILGLSIITANFDPASDVFRDRQVVSERLASTVGQLPRQALTPALTPFTSSTSTVLVAGLTSPRASLMELRTTAEWLIKPTLMAVPGVAKVAVFGSGVRSLQVQVDPDRLVRLGVGLNEVAQAAGRAVGVRGAGFIDSANQRVELKTEYPPPSVDDLRRAVLDSQHSPHATLGDVATVRFAPEAATGGATSDGRPGVQLVVSQQYGGGGHPSDRGRAGRAAAAAGAGRHRSRRDDIPAGRFHRPGDRQRLVGVADRRGAGGCGAGDLHGGLAQCRGLLHRDSAVAAGNATAAAGRRHHREHDDAWRPGGGDRRGG